MTERLGLAIDIGERAPEIGLGERLGLFDFGRSRRRLDETRDLAIDRGKDLVRAMTTCRRDREAKQRWIAEWRELRVDRRRGLLLDHELAMQPRRGAAREQRRHDLERGPIGMVLTGCFVPDEQAIGRDRLGRAHDTLFLLHRFGVLGDGRQLRGGNVRVMLGDQLAQLVVIEIADADDRGVVRRVPGPIKRANLGQRERPDIFHPANRGPAIRMDRERVRHQLLVEPAIDVVLDALAALVRDDIALGFHRRGLEHEVLHPLGLEPDAQREVARGQG